MKKIISLGLLAALCGFGTLGAFAVDPGYVSVYSNASEDHAPNLVQINFYVETSDKNLNVATEANKKIAAKVIEALKKELNTQAGEGLKTLSFNAYDEYSYKDNKKIFERYKVTNTFEVKLKDTAKLGKVINTALEAGATRVDGLRYSLDTSENVCNKLTAEAVMKAKGRAESVAKSMNMKIGGVKQIVTNCNSGNIYPQYRAVNMMSKSMDSAMGSDVPTEAGTINVNATVDAQFYLVP